MKYRLIPFRYFNAFMNMALDEAIMKSVRSGEAHPTIRFYGWDPSAVSIGIFQGILNEVNLETCKGAGVDVVRRLTGGGAVYHDRLGEVTYSIIAPVDAFDANIIVSYEQICEGIVLALKSLGLPAGFERINDILVNGRKISGNAQTRRDGILLQHGTILYNVDVNKMFSYLNVSSEKVSDKLIKSVQKRVTSVAELANVSMQDLQDSLQEGFSHERDVEIGEYSDSELKHATSIAKEKFSSEAWNFRL